MIVSFSLRKLERCNESALGIMFIVVRSEFCNPSSNHEWGYLHFFGNPTILPPAMGK